MRGFVSHCMRGLTLSLLLVLSALPAAAQRLYVHVTVVEQGRKGATVQMTLPMSLVHRAAEVLTDMGLDGECHLDLGGVELGDPELAEVIGSLRRGEDVIVESERERVRFEIRGDQVSILAHDGWDETLVTMPAALFLGAFDAAGRIDPRAALGILRQRGEGEIVISTDDETRVRVWVDRHKTIRGSER